jgi:hypothetical protein
MLHARSTSLVLALASLPLFVRPGSAPQVLVVDDGGGPGVDFADIQQAVNAAADGATILVQDGHYDGFTVLGKGLQVVAAQGADVSIEGAGISVRQVPEGSHVLLRALLAPSSDEEGLAVLHCQGAVVVEECAFQGAAGQGAFALPNYHPAGYPAVRVEDAVVVLLRSTAQGGDGSDYVLLSAEQGDGAPALLVRGDGGTVVHGGVYTGGAGGDVDDDDSAYPGGAGGDAIRLADAALVHASGAELHGGDGGLGGYDFDGFTGTFHCGDGGDGGSGIAEGDLPGQASVLDVTVDPGLGGLGYLCPAGDPGVPFDVGALTLIPEQALDLRMPGPVAESGTLVLELAGPVGAPVLLAFAPAPAVYDLPPLVGPALVSPVGLAVVGLGALPASPFALAFPLSLDLPAGTALTLYAQAVYVAPSGAVVPGAAATAVLLDSAL